MSLFVLLYWIVVILAFGSIVYDIRNTPSPPS